MATNWAYAELSKLAKLNGGPAEFINKIKWHNFQKGVVTMIPVCIGSSVFTYMKGPQIVQYCKDKLKLVTRKEALEAEQNLTDELYRMAYSVSHKCPECGKRAIGIDEIMSKFGLCETESGLQPHSMCKECREKIK